MYRYCFYALVILMATLSVGAQDTVIKQALEKKGAQPTLPVEAAKESFTPEFVQSARESFDNLHWQMAGDHALYYNLHMSEFMATAIASPNMDYRPLDRDIRPELQNLTTKTSKGEMSLREYAVHPHFKLQSMIFVHKGKVVYETYPGMRPSDRKVWASAAKTSVGLVMAMLVGEGKVDLDTPIPDYVPVLKGTVWDDVSVGHALNMATGLDNEETAAAIMNPESAVVRFFATGLVGAYRVPAGQESWVDVARDDSKLPGENPGEVFRYASINTHVLTKLIENVENKTWTRTFEDRVWSKVYARQPALFNLTPDGLALPVGLLSTTPEDMVRFAMLFTPSWRVAAAEQVVTPQLIERIQAASDPDRYAQAAKRKSSMGAFNEYAEGNAYQFDFIFSDGALAKSGNMNQMIYMDPKRDFAAIAFSNSPYHSGYGETKAPAFMRLAAKALAGEEK